MHNTSIVHIIHVIENISNKLLFVNLAVFFVICGFLYLGWCVYLFREYWKSVRFARRIESQEDSLCAESRVLAMNYRVNAKRNKFLILLLLTELIATISYTLAFCYQFFMSAYPSWKTSGLDFNSNCTQDAFKNKIWVDELRYPIVGFLVNFGRAMYLVALGIIDSLLKFITNTYVTQSWRFTRMYVSLICAGIISVFLVIIGTIPYTNIISNFLNIFALLVFLSLLSRRMSFLSNKALKWREQDMLFNASGSLIREQKNKKRRFQMLSRTFFYGLVILFCTEVIISLESVIELYLYFGKCVFPVLYNFNYTPPITEAQIPQFHLALMVISVIEQILVISAMYILFLPYIVCTIVAGVGAFLKQWRQNSSTFHFSGNAGNSEIQKSLLYDY